MRRFKIVYSPESIIEINQIVDWYNDVSPGLGKGLRKTYYTSLHALKKILLLAPSVMMIYALQ